MNTSLSGWLSFRMFVITTRVLAFGGKGCHSGEPVLPLATPRQVMALAILEFSLPCPMRPLRCSGYEKLTAPPYLAWSARTQTRPCQPCRHGACTRRTWQLPFKQGRRSVSANSAHTAAPVKADQRHSKPPLATVVVVVPEQALSPLGRYEQVQWLEVMQHMATRLANVNPLFSIEVFTDRISEVRPTLHGLFHVFPHIMLKQAISFCSGLFRILLLSWSFSEQ